MHDTNLEADIANALSSRKPGGVNIVSPASLRRFNLETDSRAFEPAPEDPATMEESSTQKSDPAARAPLLVERQTTHGNFEDNAIVSQAIKDLLRSGPGWLKLSAIERESMDMIALKFSRILSGKSMEKQHWEDVVGYARLVEEKCF